MSIKDDGPPPWTQTWWYQAGIHLCDACQQELPLQGVVTSPNGVYCSRACYEAKHPEPEVEEFEQVRR